MKGETHKKPNFSGSKFLGDTKGNRDVATNRTSGSNGGHGEKHAPAPSGGMLGKTKGNRDFPPNRTKGVSSGHGGGQHKAGG